MNRVKVVTDSTADIPEELANELEIGVIHDHINFGTQSLRDKLDISRAEFYNRLASSSEVPTTASPAGRCLQFKAPARASSGFGTMPPPLEAHASRWQLNGTTTSVTAIQLRAMLQSVSRLAPATRLEESAAS